MAFLGIFFVEFGCQSIAISRGDDYKRYWPRRGKNEI